MQVRMIKIIIIVLFMLHYLTDSTNVSSPYQLYVPAAEVIGSASGTLRPAASALVFEQEMRIFASCLGLAEIKKLLSDPARKDGFEFRDAENNVLGYSRSRGLEGFLWSRREIEAAHGRDIMVFHVKHGHFFDFALDLLDEVPGSEGLKEMIKSIREADIKIEEKDKQLMELLNTLNAILQKTAEDSNHAFWCREARIYQIFPRAYNQERVDSQGRRAESFFDSVDAAELIRLKALGIDTLYPFGIFPIGIRSRIGRAGGSVFSVSDQTRVNILLGVSEAYLRGVLQKAGLDNSACIGCLDMQFSRLPDATLSHLQSMADESFRNMVCRIHDAGMKIIIDFIPNHTSMDSLMLREHPDWFIHEVPGQNISGTELTRQYPGYFIYETANYPGRQGENIKIMVHHGAYAYNDQVWMDTAQLDYSHPALRDYMISVLEYWISEFDIDGFRVDMAHYLLNDVIESRWNKQIWHDGQWNTGAQKEFFAEAIPRAKGRKPSVAFIAEAYAYEENLSAAGFDVVYSKNEKWALRDGQWANVGRKGFYDALVTRDRRQIVGALRYLAFQRWQKGGATSLLFIANHDEEDPYEVFGDDYNPYMVLAAAIAPVLLIYNGQERGRDFKDTHARDTVEPKIMPFDIEAGFPAAIRADEFHRGLAAFMRAHRDIIKKGAADILDSANAPFYGIKLTYGGKSISIEISSAERMAYNLQLPQATAETPPIRAKNISFQVAQCC
jgi:glycosidase